MRNVAQSRQVNGFHRRTPVEEVVLNSCHPRHSREIKSRKRCSAQELLRNNSRNLRLKKQRSHLRILHSRQPRFGNVCLTQGTKCFNRLVLRRLRQHDCVSSTQFCDVLSFLLPSEAHAEAVFAQPCCRRHLLPHRLRCVVLTHLNHVFGFIIISLHTQFHCFE